MRSYTLSAAAKINLYLEIVGDHFSDEVPPQPTGFHALVMVLQSIALADTVTVRSLDTETIQVHCDHPEVPQDEHNLAYRAAILMQKQFPEAFKHQGGVGIEIQKHIPVGAGLAGGSTNAAAVLVGLDLLWDLGLTQPELQELGAKLGSDVPFCLMGGTALATGRGEQLSPLPDLAHLFVVLGKYRSLTVSTAWAYQAYRQRYGSTYVTDPLALKERWHQLNSGPLVNAITQRDSVKIGQLLHNDLEQVVLPQYPKVARLREIFQQVDVLGAMMSGSGPTVFALTESLEQANAVRATVETIFNDSSDGELRTMGADLDLWVTPLTTTGIAIV